jgi:hypothetical protein
MHHFAQLSLRRKLVLVMLLASTAAVLLTATLLVVNSWRQSRWTMIRDYTGNADLLAANCAMPLAFDDAKAAREVLATLRVQPSVLQAWLFRPDGTVFADYDRGQVWPVPVPVPREGHQLLQGHLLVFVPVAFGGQVVGRVGLPPTWACIAGDWRWIWRWPGWRSCWRWARRFGCPLGCPTWWPSRFAR